MDGRGGEQGLHPAHPGQIGVEPARGDHGQAGEPGRQVGVALGAQAPALAVIDGPHRLLGLVDPVQGRVDRDQVAGLDQPLPVLEPLGDEAPVPCLLGQTRQIARDPRARLLRGPGGLEEGALAGRLIPHRDGEGGQDRGARLQEVPVEVSDQGVAPPAGPDLGEGPGREHAHGHVRPVRVVEDQARGRDGECPARGRALQMDGVPGRPAPRRPVQPAVMLSRHVGGRQLRGQGQQNVRLDPPGLGPGRGQGALQGPSEPPEGGLGRGSGRARQAGREEHPAVVQREGRSARVEGAPSGMDEQGPAPFGHSGLQAARQLPGLGPALGSRPRSGGSSSGRSAPPRDRAPRRRACPTARPGSPRRCPRRAAAPAGSRSSRR